MSRYDATQAAQDDYDYARQADSARHHEHLQDEAEAVCREPDRDYYTPLVRDALMDALERGPNPLPTEGDFFARQKTAMRDPAYAFEDWLHDEPDFIRQMLYPGGEVTRGEIIYGYRLAFVRERLDIDGWQEVDRQFGLCVGPEF